MIYLKKFFFIVETPPSSKSDNWMSVNSVSVKTDSSTDKERETMYSEMKQNIERDNLKDKPPDGGLTASPVQVIFNTSCLQP
jgi:hypothetical protein